jgi:hypothetical protein
MQHLFLRRETDKRVQVIRHDEQQVDEPAAAFVIETCRSEEVASDGRDGELVLATRGAAERQKPDGAVRYPKRWCVRQRFTSTCELSPSRS